MMNYILNTKTKKVEIYWDNQNEYQAIINFLSQCILTEEKENQYFIKTNEIPPRTITWNTNNLPNEVTINGNSLEGIIDIATTTDKTAETAIVNLSNDKYTTYVNNSITASESEQAKQYWLNNNLTTSIKPREDKPENWQNDTYHYAGDVISGKEFFNKVLELNQKKSNITSLRS